MVDFGRRWRLGHPPVLAFGAAPAAPSTLLDGLLGFWPLRSHADDVVNAVASTASGITFRGQSGRILAGAQLPIGSGSVTTGVTGPLGAAHRTVAGWFRQPDGNTTARYVWAMGVRGTGQEVGLLTRQQTSSARWQLLVGSAGYDIASKPPAWDRDWHHIAVTYDGTNLTPYINGVARAPTAATLTTQSGPFLIGTGGYAGWQTPSEVSCSEVGLWDRVLTQDEITELVGGLDGESYPFTTPTSVLASDWLGDSITAGASLSEAQRAPSLVEASTHRACVNMGVPGYTAAQVATLVWDVYTKYSPHRWLIWAAAVNSLASGQTGAQTMTTVQGVLDAARVLGKSIVACGVLPWKGASGWTAPIQVETEDYNSRLAAYCTANGHNYVDPSSLGGEGGDPDVLLAAYDSGDHLHLNAAGAAAWAALVQAQLPSGFFL